MFWFTFWTHTSHKMLHMHTCIYISVLEQTCIYISVQEPQLSCRLTGANTLQHTPYSILLALTLQHTLQHTHIFTTRFPLILTVGLGGQKSPIYPQKSPIHHKRALNIRKKALCMTWLFKVTRLILMCDMTQSNVWKDAFLFVTTLFLRVTRFFHECDMTDSHVCLQNMYENI